MLIYIMVSWRSWGTIKGVQIDHNIICMVYMPFDVVVLVVYQSEQHWITYC